MSYVSDLFLSLDKRYEYIKVVYNRVFNKILQANKDLAFENSVYFSWPPHCPEREQKTTSSLTLFYTRCKLNKLSELKAILQKRRGVHALFAEY